LVFPRMNLVRVLTFPLKIKSKIICEQQDNLTNSCCCANLSVRLLRPETIGHDYSWKVTPLLVRGGGKESFPLPFGPQGYHPSKAKWVAPDIGVSRKMQSDSPASGFEGEQAPPPRICIQAWRMTGAWSANSAPYLICSASS